MEEGPLMQNHVHSSCDSPEVLRGSRASSEGTQRRFHILTERTGHSRCDERSRTLEAAAFRSAGESRSRQSVGMRRRSGSTSHTRGEESTMDKWTYGKGPPVGAHKRTALSGSQHLTAFERFHLFQASALPESLTRVHVATHRGSRNVTNRMRCSAVALR